MNTRFSVGMGLMLLASLVWAAGDGEDDSLVLNYWTWHPSAEVLQPVIDRYEALNPGVTVDLNVMEATVYQERLPVALASGEEIDVFGVQTGLMPSQLKGYMVPLDDYFAAIAGSDWERTFNPADLAIGRAQTGTDELLFITHGRYGSAIGLYNAAIFAALEIAVPTTYEEMVAVAATIRNEMPDIIPVVFTGDAWFQDEIVLTILAQRSDLFNEIRYGDGRWDDPAYVQALADYKRMFDDGVFQNMGDVGYGRAAELFDTGQAAIFYQGTWEAPRLSSEFRAQRGIPLENVGAMALPVMRAGDKPTLRAFTEGGMAMPNYAETNATAADFIFYMTGGAGFDMLNEQTFLVPNKVGSQLPARLFDSDQGREGWNLAVELVTNATSHRNNMSAFSDVVGQFIQRVVMGDYGDDMAQAAADIQAEFESGRY